MFFGVTGLAIRKYFRGINSNAPRLETLPIDILIYGIFCYIDIRDIFQLRRTSRFFYALTMERKFWKRFIIVLPTMLQPRPEPYGRRVKGLSNLEVESHLIRSLALENLWTRHDPYAMASFTQTVDMEREIINVTITPGGRFFVICAKVADWYQVLICGMSDERGLLALGRTPPLESKPFHVQAKFVPVGGVNELLVTYKSRVCRYSDDKDALENLGIDISSFSEDHEFETPVYLDHIFTVLRVSLPILEEMLDIKTRFPESKMARQLLPKEKAIISMSHTRAREPFVSSDIGEVHGLPYLIMVKGQNCLRLKIIGKEHAQIKHECEPLAGFEKFRHKILSVRLLPNQAHLLVVRELQRMSPKHRVLTSFELYSVPKMTHSPEAPNSSETCKMELVEHKVHEIDGCIGIGAAWITDPSCLVGDEATQSVSRKAIQLYLRIEFARVDVESERWDKVYGLRRYSIQAKGYMEDLPGGGAEQRYRYTLCDHAHYMQELGESWFRVLPGRQRSIILTSPVDDISDASPIQRAFRVVDREYALPRHHTVPPWGIYGYLVVPFEFGDHRWKAIAWDDTSGKMCLAKENDSTLVVTQLGEAPLAG